MILAAASAHLPHDDQPGVNSHAVGQSVAFVPLQPSIERPDGLHQSKPGANGAPGVVCMRLGIINVHQQAIAEILRDMSLPPSR